MKKYKLHFVSGQTMILDHTTLAVLHKTICKKSLTTKQPIIWAKEGDDDSNFAYIINLEHLTFIEPIDENN